MGCGGADAFHRRIGGREHGRTDGFARARRWAASCGRDQWGGGGARRTRIIASSRARTPGRPALTDVHLLCSHLTVCVAPERSFCAVTIARVRTCRLVRRASRPSATWPPRPEAEGGRQAGLGRDMEEGAESRTRARARGGEMHNNQQRRQISRISSHLAHAPRPPAPLRLTPFVRALIKMS